MSGEAYILRADCPDDIGIVADVMGYLAQHGLSVTENRDFGDPVSKRFFIWAKFEASAGFNLAEFNTGFVALAARRNMNWLLRRAADLPKALIMVSKGDHCLNDLLYRDRRGRLGAKVCAIVSNHPDAQWHADRHQIPFYHVPVTKTTKPEAEQALRALITKTGADMIVLARYMQVLSNDLSRDLEGRCINIHHSALPSFKGARPYHQAYEHGVKLMGATAHYVTADLDEGPIIAQDVASVDHRLLPDR
ncbi:MAG: formyltetrahydrofolate deformylase, partial [Pseudomonadota bacterium]